LFVCEARKRNETRELRAPRPFRAGRRVVYTLDMGVRAARGAAGAAAAALGAAAPRLFGCPSSAAGARRRAGSPGGLWKII